VGLYGNCNEFSCCVTDGQYPNAKFKTLFFGAESQDRCYPEQETVAGCCEHLNERLRLPWVAERMLASYGLCFTKLVGYAIVTKFTGPVSLRDRYHWLRCLTRGSAAIRLLELWVRIQRGHGCLSLVSVVCCQVEVSAWGWSLVQRSPTECGLPECDREASIMRRSWPIGGCCAGEGGGEVYLERDSVTFPVDRWSKGYKKL
jgi:hypothetical protein